MSSPIATYSFLPWLRQGLANQIQPGAATVRATVKVKLDVAGTGIDADKHAAVEKDVSIYGPGDIVGIDRKAIVRSEPHHWITNFEPNYLPFLEFYDEDFPWRYTPTVADKNLHRLTPWIALAVLEEGAEFSEGKNVLNRPLPFITIKGDPMKVLPRWDELWAWAHVHVNEALHSGSDTVAPDTNSALAELENVLKTNPDLAYSRLLSPRNLLENKTYHAFVIPAFETGRLAGLGKVIPGALSAAKPAWSAAPGDEGGSFPYYFRWQFRTGAMGDFEYLVRLLKPRPMPAKVGQRDMDVQKPEANLPNLGVLSDILRLGGALRTPVSTLKPADKTEFNRYDLWATPPVPPGHPYPQIFQERLAALLNLADDYSQANAATANAAANVPPPAANESADPVITAPIYGRWHAAVTRVLKKRDGTDVPFNQNWIHDLNLDPRYRVAAGFGTRVVQENQENYMDKAWEQLGAILEANRFLRRGQFSMAVERQWHTKYIGAMAAAEPAKLMMLTAPVQRRVVAGGFTLSHRVAASPLTRTALSAPFRKVLRSNGRALKLSVFGGRGPAMPNLLERWNKGEIAPARPKVLPPGLPTIDQVAGQALPKNVPGWLLDLLRQFPWLPWAVLAIALLILLLLLLFGVCGILAGLAILGAAFFLFRLLQRWQKQVAVADGLTETGRTPEAVDHLPRIPDFHISRPGDGYRPRPGATDSAEGIRFKEALRGLYTLEGAIVKTPPRPKAVPLDFSGLIGTVVAGIDPQKTLPAQVWSQVLVPVRIEENLIFDFDEIMEYPKIDFPMYKPLCEISSELFLPNIQLIEQNTISLLETNQKFIEAYMVGINHEFARELLWREFPTDQRGSYFRQFWDISAYLDPHDPNAAERREALFDIEEIHKWPPNSDLGKNDPKDATSPPKEEVVLVVRGELLKRYPNAVIYAHRAVWRRVGNTPAGAIDKTRPRILLDPLSNEDNPPRTEVKTPLYGAQVAPDIFFFGFDLTIDEAKGESAAQPDDPGWFFVIKERPGEPRFGLDEGKNNVVRTWNDLGWENVQQENSFLRAAQNDLQISAPNADDPQGILQQSGEDDDIKWTANSNAADIAYVLYQVPVLVAVHASDMLPKQ
jgi:hypothetical protein